MHSHAERGNEKDEPMRPESGRGASRMHSHAERGNEKDEPIRLASGRGASRMHSHAERGNEKPPADHPIELNQSFFSPSGRKKRLETHLLEEALDPIHPSG